MEPVPQRSDQLRFSWWWFCALHGLAFVVYGLLGYDNASGEAYWSAVTLFGIFTVLLAVSAAEGKRYGRAVAVLTGGIFLQVAAVAFGVVIAFAYHFTLF